MNNFITRIVLAVVLFTTAVTSVYSQETTKVEDAVNKLVNKYDGKDEVNCVTVAKGSGLELVKMALNKELGKSFMKGVKSITIIDYTDASKETCEALRKDLDTFLVLLNEFNLNNEKQFADNDYIRCFATEESGVLSDFVIALENDKSKTVMHMAGKIIIE